MVNIVGLVTLYAACICTIISPVWAQDETEKSDLPTQTRGATPDHVASIDPDSMPSKCGVECTLASEKLVNCNRNATCYCDDVTTLPILTCFRCAVESGYSTGKANDVFRKISVNCEKYETPVNNVSLSGAARVSISVAALAGLGATALFWLS